MDLLQQISVFFKKKDIQNFKKSFISLHTRYREGETLNKENELYTYLIVRLPATYATLKYVISKIPEAGSILDIGAGPGTTWWAACSVWKTKPSVTAIENEQKFIELGKNLGSEVRWVQKDVLSFKSFDPHDWVIFSYSLGELPENALSSVLNKCWEAAQKGLVIIEPGTPRGYQRMLFSRNLILAKNGSVLAPCPHANACPLKSPDWCHFYVRLERSKLHKQIKNATLPFEDEKFSYIILTKEYSLNKSSRVIRRPSSHSGHVILPLCSSEGLKNITISRCQKDLYKKSRKLDWGDKFE